MEKRYDVAALGELLIDFTRSGVSPQGNPLWEANPGALRVMPKAQEIKALLELTKR